MERKKFGLALGSGGWRGLAHIGVIKSLTQNNIPINYIAGSSIGSIIGGMYAAIKDVNELEKIANSLSFKSIVKSIFQKSSIKASILNNKFDRFFRNIIGDIQIEDLKIPYCAVGSNLLTGKPMVFNKGSLITAMKASSAIPVFFNPVQVSDQMVVDGGMVAPVPTEIVKQMGADIIMGVSLYEGIFPINLDPKEKLSKIKAGKISRFLSLKTLSEFNLSMADFPLKLKIPNEDYGFFSKFFNNQEIINYGYEVTNPLLEEIAESLKYKPTKTQVF